MSIDVLTLDTEEQSIERVIGLPATRLSQAVTNKKMVAIVETDTKNTGLAFVTRRFRVSRDTELLWSRYSSLLLKVRQPGSTFTEQVIEEQDVRGHPCLF